MQYLGNCSIESDDHAEERSQREMTLGRENYVFASCDTDGERAVASRRLIGTAKLTGIDIDALLPWRFGAEVQKEPTHSA